MSQNIVQPGMNLEVIPGFHRDAVVEGRGRKALLDSQTPFDNLRAHGFRFGILLKFSREA
jgi:hypothetical protein